MPPDQKPDVKCFIAGAVILRGGEKAWVILFTCAIYRAVHLELITSLSTDVFIQGIRRFIATLITDHGTNFIKTHFNNRLRYLQKLRRDLRIRFEREYLANLVYDPKSKNREINVKVGDIVLLKTDGVKKIRWPLGKVIETIPGKDGKVRVLKIKTSSGTVLRPCQRVCPLEVNHSEQLTFSASAFPAVQIS